ncbi:hypothetical protein L208DRAFT_1327955, partial [Tricholoma matsutake]
ELCVSHKLVEKKQWKEIKDLFNDLYDQLPADHSMKVSKWETLSKGDPHKFEISTCGRVQVTSSIPLLLLYSHVSS